MKDYKLKDEILNHIVNSVITDSKDISEDLNIEHSKVLMLLHIIDDDRYIRLNDPESSMSLIQNMEIESKGRAFFYQGGYTAQHKKEWRSSLKKGFFQVLTILFSLVTIIIAFLQVKLSDRTNELEDKNDQLQMQVDSLKNKITEKPASLKVDTILHNDAVNIK